MLSKIILYLHRMLIRYDYSVFKEFIMLSYSFRVEYLANNFKHDYQSFKLKNIER